MKNAFKPTRTSLYQQITEHLRSEIHSMEPGTRLEPENQMAERFSVSIITVRQALRILASENLIERHAGKGTFVLPPPAETHQKPIAILIDEDVSHPQSSPVYLKIAQRLREGLSRHGISSRLYVGQNPPGIIKSELNSPEFSIDLEHKKVSGVAAILAQSTSQWTKVAARQQLPVVGFGGEFPYGAEAREPYIPEALSILKSQGCRTVGFLTWFGIGKSVGSSIDQLITLVTQNDMETRPDWIRCGDNPSNVGAGWNEFRELWQSPGDKPDGIIITDDMLFKGFIPAISELRIEIPQELKVVVRSNKDVGTLYPFPVTRFELNPKEVATALEEKLVSLLAHNPPQPPLAKIPHRLQKHNELKYVAQFRLPKTAGVAV